MERKTLMDLVGKEIGITDFYIKKSMKAKADIANVEFKLNGKDYYFTTSSPYVIYQLTWIKQCILDYKLNTRRNVKGIRFIKMRESDPSLQSAVNNVMKAMNKLPDNTLKSFIIFSDNTCNNKENCDPYLTFYNKSIFVKVIREKNAIYFSFTLSKEFVNNLIKEDSKKYHNMVDKIG